MAEISKERRARDTIDVAEGAQRIGSSRAHVYRSIQRGDLPGIKIGGRVFLLRRPFEKLLRSSDPTGRDHKKKNRRA